MDVSVSVIVEEREGERWEGEKREGELERRGEKREGGKGRVEVEGRRRGKELHEYGYCETFTVLYCTVLHYTLTVLYVHCTALHVLHCTYCIVRTVCCCYPSGETYSFSIQCLFYSTYNGAIVKKSGKHFFSDNSELISR